MHTSSQLRCSPWGAFGPLTREAVAAVLIAVLLLLCSLSSASAQPPVVIPGSSCYYYNTTQLGCVLITASPEYILGCGVTGASASWVTGTCRQTIVSSNQKLCTYKARTEFDVCDRLMADYGAPWCRQDVIDYERVNGVVTDCASMQLPVNQVSSSPPSTYDTYSGGSPPLNYGGSPPLNYGGSPPVNFGGSPPFNSGGSPPVNFPGSPPLYSGGSPPLNSEGSPPVDSPTPSPEPEPIPVTVEEFPSPSPALEPPSSPPAIANAGNIGNTIANIATGIANIGNTTNTPSSPTPDTIASPKPNTTPIPEPAANPTKSDGTNTSVPPPPQSPADPSKQCGQQQPVFYVFVVLAFVLIILSTVLAVMAAWPRQLQKGGRAGGSVLDASASIAGIAVGVIGFVTQNYVCWGDMLVMFAVVYLAAAANGSVWLWLLGPQAQSDTQDAKEAACKMMVRFLLGVGSTIGVVLAAVGLLQQTDPETACILHVMWVQGVCNSHLGVAGQGAPVGKPTWMVTSKHMFVIVLLIVAVQSVIGMIGMIWECCTPRDSDSRKQGLLRMATLCLGWNVICIAAGAVLFIVQLQFLTQPSSHYTIVLTTIIALWVVFAVLLVCIFVNLGAQARGAWSLPVMTVPGHQYYVGMPGQGPPMAAQPGPSY